MVYTRDPIGFNPILSDSIPSTDYEGVLHVCPRIDVLDHGYIRLVDSMGGDLDISRAARTSYDAQWRAGKDKGSDWNLIHYLWSHHHTTPFEAVEFKFDVYAPIFVFRQWHRHRTWSYNEMSARYVELEDKFYVPDQRVIGTQSKSSKQARDIAHNAPVALNKKSIEVMGYSVICTESFKKYHQLLAAGWPREIARGVLPVSTYSLMTAKVDLLNLLKFLTLRTHEHAQWEIRQYAYAMYRLVEPVVPIAMEAWIKSIDWDLPDFPEGNNVSE